MASKLKTAVRHRSTVSTNDEPLDEIEGVENDDGTSPPISPPFSSVQPAIESPPMESAESLDPNSTSTIDPNIDPDSIPSLSPETKQEIADRLNRALDDPEVRKVLASRAFEIEVLRKGPKFDLNDNRVMIELDGAIIPHLEKQWNEHNAALLPGDRMDFSKFIAMRVRRCVDHVDARFGYLSGDQLRRVEQIADESFIDGSSILQWIERTRILHVPDDQGNTLTLDPLPPRVLGMLMDRLYDGETLPHLINRIVQKATHEYVNVDYLEPWT